MIGGIDTDLPTRAGERSIEVAVRVVRQHWPHSVYENPETADRYDRFSQIPFGEIAEIFVYRDSNAAHEWDQHGAIPELYNTMVHVLADLKTVTVVVDEKTTEMDGLIADLAAALTDEVLFVPADLVSLSQEAA